MGMWKPFSEPARRSMVLAQELAQRLGNASIDADHLFVGVANAGHNGASDAMASLGVDETKVNDAAEALMPRGNEHVDDLVFTPRAKHIIELSFEESHALGSSSIGAEHLLLGYLRDCKDGSRLLERLHLDSAELRGKVISALKEPRKPAAARATRPSLDAAYDRAGAFSAGADEDALWAHLQSAAETRDAAKALLYAVALCRRLGWSASHAAGEIESHLTEPT